MGDMILDSQGAHAIDLCSALVHGRWAGTEDQLFSS